MNFYIVMHSDTHAGCKQPALHDDPYGILPKPVSPTHLLHYPSLPFGERRVPSQFVVYVFHFDLHTTLSLFAIGRWRFLGLKRCIAVVRYVGHGTVLQADALRGSLVVALVRGPLDAGSRHRTGLHAGPQPAAATKRAGRPASAVHVRHLAEESHTIRPEAGLPRSAGRVHYNLAVRHSNRCAHALCTPHRPNAERRLTENAKEPRAGLTSRPLGPRLTSRGCVPRTSTSICLCLARCVQYLWNGTETRSAAVTRHIRRKSERSPGTRERFSARNPY